MPADQPDILYRVPASVKPPPPTESASSNTPSAPKMTAFAGVKLKGRKPPLSTAGNQLKEPARKTAGKPKTPKHTSKPLSKVLTPRSQRQSAFAGVFFEKESPRVPIVPWLQRVKEALVALTPTGSRLSHWRSKVLRSRQGADGAEGDRAELMALNALQEMKETRSDAADPKQPQTEVVWKAVSAAVECPGCKQGCSGCGARSPVSSPRNVVVASLKNETEVVWKAVSAEFEPSSPRQRAQHKFGTSDIENETNAHCFQSLLNSDSGDSEAWHSLGYQGGGSVKGQNFSEVECYQRALEADRTNKQAWRNLSRAGGGQVNSRQYSEAQCLDQSQQLDAAAFPSDAMQRPRGIENDGSIQDPAAGSVDEEKSGARRLSCASAASDDTCDQARQWWASKQLYNTLETASATTQPALDTPHTPSLVAPGDGNDEVIVVRAMMKDSSAIGKKSTIWKLCGPDLRLRDLDSIFDEIEQSVHHNLSPDAVLEHLTFTCTGPGPHTRTVTRGKGQSLSTCSYKAGTLINATCTIPEVVDEVIVVRATVVGSKTSTICKLCGPDMQTKELDCIFDEIEQSVRRSSSSPDAVLKELTFTCTAPGPHSRTVTRGKGQSLSTCNYKAGTLINATCTISDEAEVKEESEIFVDLAPVSPRTSRQINQSSGKVSGEQQSEATLANFKLYASFDRKALKTFSKRPMFNVADFRLYLIESGVCKAEVDACTDASALLELDKHKNRTTKRFR